MDSGKGMGSALSAALLTLVISACLRATDNMVSTTVPLLGTYVFVLGTIYGGIFTAVYSGSSLISNLVINPRLYGITRRRVFSGALGLILVSILVIPFASAIAVLALGVVVGLCIGIIYPNVAAAASLYAETYHSERLISIYALGLSISLVLGPLLESYLLGFGYTAVFLVFGVVAAVAFGLSSKIQLSGMERMPAKISPLARRGLVEGVLTGAIFFIPFGAISVFLPIYAVDAFGVSTAVAYTSYIPLYVVSLLVRVVLVVRPLRRIDTPIFVSMIITLGGLVALFLAPSFTMLLLVVGLIGIPHGLTFTLSLILVSRTSSDTERNTTNSRLNAFYSVFYIVVPIAVSSASELVGIREAFFLLLLPVAIVCLYLLRLFRREGPSLHLADQSWGRQVEARGKPDDHQRPHDPGEPPTAKNFHPVVQFVVNLTLKRIPIIAVFSIRLAAFRHRNSPSPPATG